MFFSRQLPHHPMSTLFPYTTLFRSNWYPLLRLRYTPHNINQMRTCCRRAKNSVAGQALVDTKARFERLFSRREPSEHLSSPRSEEHTSELQSLRHLVCRLLLEKKNI